jgi:hypothetical protein
LTHQPAFRFSYPGHRRLIYCTIASAVAILGFIVLFDWPAGRPDSMSRDMIELTLPRDRPEPQPATDRPAEQAADEPPVVDEETAVPEPPQPATVVQQEERPPAFAGSQHDAPAEQPEIDWQASLERASAEIIRRYSEVASLHPEFEELRRIARQRYAEPRTGKPPPIWENVEQDIYGRTLLQLGNGCYKVLDDSNVGNRYAFETFERHMLFCNVLAQAPPQQFPWVETIVERYAYLREPDGGWLQKSALRSETRP